MLIFFYSFIFFSSHPWFQGCILAGISFLSISSILLPTRKSGIRRDKYLSAAIFKEAVRSVALNSGLYDGFLFYVIIYSPEV